MQTRRIGELEVSVVGLGCNNFGMRIDESQTATVVAAALEAGINFFDTADVYGGGHSEEFLGRALGPRRDEALIATKFGSPMGTDPAHRGASPRWIAQAVEDSLRRLNTDRIDLYQLHVPDADTPVEDTLAALDKLVGAGKVRAIGCSNFSGEQIDEAAKASDSRGTASFASVQNHYSLLHREPEKEVTDASQRHGLGLLPYFPLASGLLTGKYTSPNNLPKGTRLQLMAELAPERAKRFLSNENFDIVGRLRSFCEERSRTMLELAFSWLLAQPVVPSVIAGATSADQVRANVAASGWELGPEDLEEIDNLTRGA